ncbi:CARDB domain-containing protein [Gloeothece verrucosa]|uniref:Phosphoesterase PA-phosphatase related protein n=1 Tax=Gloeothece verrucosa (strain PCC 7822) TaxID=497965 RepID=E0UF84_GLOV7|nr:CARDB domain-containing protein [Gloeothece verrucosa]ADN15455.1 phosphoesterase PA-phosphatase related protein [Gloeothece verrucosa PCC 7822]
MSSTNSISVVDLNVANPLAEQNLSSLAKNLNLDVESDEIDKIYKAASSSPDSIIESQGNSVSNNTANNSSPQPANNSNIASNQTLTGQGPDLIAQFTKIKLPDTVEFGDQGQVKIKITNQGNTTATGPINLELWSSTDNNIDKNDVLLANQTKNINLKPFQSITLTINYDNNTSAIAPGAYNLIARVDSQNQVAELEENNNTVSRLVSAPNTDVVIDWNATALNAIQAEGEAGRGIPPTVGSRLLALVSTAVYDTVNAFKHNYTAYAVDVNAPKGASLQAAAVGAAYRVLTQLIPQQTTLFNQQLVKSLAEITDLPVAETAGTLFGYSVADQILALRANDGSNNNAPYVPPTGDYVWQPDAPDFIALSPNWGQVTPWAIPSEEAFAPNGLDGTPTHNPTLYAENIEEVRKIGGRFNTDITTLTRTPDQTQVAHFWSYDRADTFRPYGQLNQIAEEVAVREGTSLAENARLFASLNVALADAAIVAWAAKYKYTQPRPDDVIAGGIAANDGIDATVADPNWKPLLDTPPFPDYISGHSTFAGAFAGVLKNFFGDNYEFSVVSQELPGIVRNYNSFSDLATEDAISRVYGGVHVRESTITDALPTGLNIGNYVAENLFQPVA